MATAKTIAPFLWGSNGEALSPEEVKTRRSRADALRAPAGYTPKGWWSLLGALAGEGVAQYKEGEADAAEKAGHSKVAEALKNARETGDYMSVLGDEWATPQQMSVANALQGRAWQQEDQQAQWAREDARAARAASLAAAEAAKPKWMTLESGGDVYRYNANDPNSRPELFFDAPDAPSKPIEVNGQLVDPVTHEVLGDYRTPPEPPKPLIINNQIVDPATKEVVADYRDPPKDTGANFDDISSIRKEVQGLPSYKNLAQATPIYKSMAETAGRDSRASDLNLVYGLGKIMDPTSVVREGEMFMVQGINTLPDKLVEGINSVLTGTSTLSPDTRKAIMTEAYSRLKGYEDAFNQDATTYKALADRYKINPEDILPGFQQASPYNPAPTANGGQPKPVASEAEYMALPSGTQYVAPDGTVRTKP